MISSPRIQEYITWIAPKEKAGMYMGMNFLSLMLGAALSGIVYTTLYGFFRDDLGRPDLVWYTLAGHLILSIFVMGLFKKFAGEFKEREE